MTAKIPIALQLYSVRKDCDENLPQVLEAVGKMGYEAVEFYGYREHHFLGHGAADLRKMLDDNGLKCCGTHMSLHTLQGDELAKSIEFHKTIGNKYLIVASLPHDQLIDRDALLKIAEEFNRIAEKLAPEDMLTGYHNHHVEFKPIDGTLPWDTFFGNTSKEVVMQLDTGNALIGGGDPVPFVERYPGRALTVHLKEHSDTNDKALIGEGDVRWDEMFKLCETVGATRWYIVEQESYAYPPLECVERCLKTLREMGK